jgi:hypothetical protein
MAVGVGMAVAVRVRGAVVVAHRAAVAVGAALGREGLVRGAQVGAELAQHRLQHMVGADHQMVGRDLAGRVAVADMPGEARQVARDHQHGFGRGGDGDDAAVLEQEGVAVIEADRLGQVDEEAVARGQAQPLAAQEAGLVVQRDGVGGGASVPGAEDLAGGGQVGHGRAFA